MQYNEEVLPFEVWYLDTKERPCFGTREKKINRIVRPYRQHVSEIQNRVITILKLLKDAGIDLRLGAMTYNNKNWMSSTVGFHIKYAMPPDVFLARYWPKYYEKEKHLLKDEKKKPDKDNLKKSFEIDYYGKYLGLLCQFIKSKDVVDMGSIIRAKDNLLVQTGPVVLWKGGTLTCENLNDEHLNDFERAIVNIFGIERFFNTAIKKEDFGFSVCIFVTEYKVDESPSKAKICIGAKIDEQRFIQTINPSEDIKESFLAAHKYVDKEIPYQKKEY